MGTSGKPLRINTLYSYHAGPFLARPFTRRLLAVPYIVVNVS